MRTIDHVGKKRSSVERSKTNIKHTLNTKENSTCHFCFRFLYILLRKRLFPSNKDVSNVDKLIRNIKQCHVLDNSSSVRKLFSFTCALF